MFVALCAMVSIMPTPTVALVSRSMTMKPPSSRLSAKRSRAIGAVRAMLTSATSLTAERLGRDLLEAC